jgi:hypothetical protein
MSEPWIMTRPGNVVGKAVHVLSDDEAEKLLIVLDALRADMAPIVFTRLELHELSRELRQLFISYEFAAGRRALERICRNADAHPVQTEPKP